MVVAIKFPYEVRLDDDDIWDDDDDDWDDDDEDDF